MKLLLFLFLAWVSVAQAQTASQRPIIALALSDSTLTSLPQQYDFYYSAKQAAEFIKISVSSYALDDKLKKYRFRDKVYTQFVPKGLKTTDKFDDYVLIGSGKMDEIRSNDEW